VARMLTVTRTCQMQQLDPLTYLTAASSSSSRRVATVKVL
jgi:hypothetical protein